MRLPAAALVLTLTACQAAPGTPAWQSAFGYSAESLYRFEIRDLGYPFVPVGIGDTTIWLPFDTGNMVGLTLENTHFQHLALPCSEHWDRLDSAGEPISTGCIAREMAATVFGATHAPVSVYEFAHDLLPGLVGPDMLPGSRFTMDYAHEIMAIDDGGEAAEVPGYEAVPLVRSPRYPLLILVHGRVRGRDVLVEIDTGKSRTTVDRRLVADLELEETPRGANVGEVELGSRSFNLGPARVVDTSGIGEGLPLPISLGVGSDTLAQFVFTVDYRTGVLWIQIHQ